MDRNGEDRVWDVIEKTVICMMTTRFRGGLRARPLEAIPNKDEGTIFFLTDRRGLKDDEIEVDPQICLVFIYPKEKVYLSLTGAASVGRDPAKARELWTDKQRVWWPDGPEDSNLLVLRVEPERAEIWDGPASSALAAYEFAKAKLTGKKPDLGENRKSTIEMD